MAVIEYPAVLGSFLQDGYAYQLNAGIKRTQFQNGNARQRRAANQRTRLNVSQKLTASQMQVFEVFLLKSAWDWFLVNIETGEGYRQTECRIVEGSVTAQLTSKVSGGESLYHVAMILELQKTNVIADDPDLTAEYIEVFYLYGLTDIQNAETINPLSPLVGV